MWSLVQTEGGLLRPSQPSAVGDLSPISMYEKNNTNCQHVYQCIGYLIDMWALVQTEGGLLRPWPHRHLLLLTCLHTVHVYVIMYRESSSDCHMHSKHVYHCIGYFEEYIYWHKISELLCKLREVYSGSVWPSQPYAMSPHCSENNGIKYNAACNQQSNIMHVY